MKTSSKLQALFYLFSIVSITLLVYSKELWVMLIPIILLVLWVAVKEREEHEEFIERYDNINRIDEVRTRVEKLNDIFD